MGHCVPKLGLRVRNNVLPHMDEIDTPRDLGVGGTVILTWILETCSIADSKGGLL